MIAPTFDLPAELSATAPPAVRDDVRLLVARSGHVRHARFAQLADELLPGDLLVVNTSATFPAAVDGRRTDGRAVTVHFATGLDDGRWVVELRAPGRSEGPLPDVRADEWIVLPAGVLLHVVAPSPSGQRRLWRAEIGIDGGVVAYLHRHGRPIRYAYVTTDHTIDEYQTVFAREPGSAEMPSAGRPFTAELVTELVTRGVAVAPITLHTGVSSQEPGEPPQPERFLVSESTARLANLTRAAGSRVVAVGTTATRALESAADAQGVVRVASGWTDLVLGPQRPARVVGGIVTGWHAPGASHLQLLEAVAGRELVDLAYREALRHRYRWHEFGDSCLLLPDG